MSDFITTKLFTNAKITDREAKRIVEELLKAGFVTGDYNEPVRGEDYVMEFIEIAPSELEATVSEELRKSKYIHLTFFDRKSGLDFTVTISIEPSAEPISITVIEKFNFDVSRMLPYIEGEAIHPNALECLQRAEAYLKAIKTVLSVVGEKIHYGIGDINSGLSNLLDDAGVRAFLEYSLPVCWINFYGKKLAGKIGVDELLAVPAYRTEKVGGGVLIITMPIPESFIPKEKDVLGQPDEIKFLANYNDVSQQIHVYFKQRKLLERIHGPWPLGFLKKLRGID